MSIPADGTVAAVPEGRSVLATRRLCSSLGLSALRPKDLKHLSVALAEAASDEFGHNHAFAERVRTLYRELADSGKAGSSGRHTRPKPIKAKLVPIRQVDPALFGPDKPLDPYLMQYAYGDEQLRPALEDFPASELKKAAALVAQRNPGTKPTSRAQKQALMEYILHYVRQ